MGRAGDSKAFLAVAAALMAGLVIATMLAINAKLQSALAPTVERAGAPAIKMIPPAAAPLLQSTAAPSIANSGSNSGSKSLNNSGPATPHLVASPRPRAIAPAATSPAGNGSWSRMPLIARSALSSRTVASRERF